MKNFIIIFTDDYSDKHYGPFTKDEIPAFVDTFSKKYNKTVEIEKNRIILKTKNPYYDKNAKIEQKEFFTGYIGEIVELTTTLPDCFIIRDGH